MGAAVVVVMQGLGFLGFGGCGGVGRVVRVVGEEGEGLEFAADPEAGARDEVWRGGKLHGGRWWAVLGDSVGAYV
jgi:hypothetical protein